jgi:hypothetical protein
MRKLLYFNFFSASFIIIIIIIIIIQKIAATACYSESY